MQTTIAVDLAKNVFEIAVSRHPGRIAERKRLSRSATISALVVKKPTSDALSTNSQATAPSQ